MDLVKALASQYMKEELPEVQVGDTVRVHVRIKEGSRERIQVFEGTVIARKHGGIGETITVRRISYGVGCEKVFPLHSPNVAMIETVRHGKVRRAKLYYLRDRMGKAAKIKEKGIGAYQGGTCNETDRSAQVCVHCAMATQPVQILAKPGMGVDEGYMIVYNEMNRIIAMRKAKKQAK